MGYLGTRFWRQIEQVSQTFSEKVCRCVLEKMQKTNYKLVSLLFARAV